MGEGKQVPFESFAVGTKHPVLLTDYYGRSRCMAAQLEIHLFPPALVDKSVKLWAS